MRKRILQRIEKMRKTYSPYVAENCRTRFTDRAIYKHNPTLAKLQRHDFECVITLKLYRHEFEAVIDESKTNWKSDVSVFNLFLNRQSNFERHEQRRISSKIWLSLTSLKKITSPSQAWIAFPSTSPARSLRLPLLPTTHRNDSIL